MKLGVCSDLQSISIAAQAGFDYVECALNQLAGMPEKKFTALFAQACTFPIPVSKCNCFLPRDVHVTGPEANEMQILAYLDKALSRAQKLGIHLAVFGSGGSRRVPEGFDYGAAWRQIADFLRLAGEYGDKYDIDIVIEPLRRQECNILNYVSEAAAVAALVNHPRVCVLGDTFHMLTGQEPWEALSQAGIRLKHIHVSRCLPDMSGRVYPAPEDGEDYQTLFLTLRTMGYTGDISVEASTTDLLKDGCMAVECLKKEMDV